MRQGRARSRRRLGLTGQHRSLYRGGLFVKIRSLPWRVRRQPSAARGPSPASQAAGYKAFISYSHAVDGKLAPALHGALHRFAKPWYRPRALRVKR